MECLENLEACAEKRDKQEKVRNQTVRETQPFSPFWKLESKKIDCNYYPGKCNIF